MNTTPLQFLGEEILNFCFFLLLKLITYEHLMILHIRIVYLKLVCTVKTTQYNTVLHISYI